MFDVLLLASLIPTFPVIPPQSPPTAVPGLIYLSPISNTEESEFTPPATCLACEGAVITVGGKRRSATVEHHAGTAVLLLLLLL